MNEKINVKGNLELRQFRNGEIIDSRNIHNTILTIGKSQIAGHLIADMNVGSRVDWMALGIGSDTILPGDTVLGSQYLKYGLGSITGQRMTTTTANDTAQWIGSFGIDTTKGLNEAGLFNASGLDTGSMYARTCFATINVGSGDIILADWRIAFS
jgi:hypothetical protein